METNKDEIETNKDEIETKHQFVNHESWTQELQREPNPSWLKQRDIGSGKKSTYIPLPIQQALADKFFREFDVFKSHYMVVANEILCSVEISILPDYPHSEHRLIEGTAAKPIQQDSQVPASSFPQGKKKNGLEYNAPAARASAISNALTTFANVFGRNLSRDIKNNFSFIKEKEDGNSGK